MATKLDVEGPNKNGDYRIYELHTGSRLMIYEGPNPMHHIIQLQETLPAPPEPTK